MAQNVENDLETWINLQGLKEGLVYCPNWKEATLNLKP